METQIKLKYILYAAAFIFVVSAIIWLSGTFKGCSKDYVQTESDSLLNAKLDSITAIIQTDIRCNNQKYDSTINNANLERKLNQSEFNFYMSEFIKSNSKKKSLPQPLNVPESHIMTDTTRIKASA